jgi:hypothetical protein
MEIARSMASRWWGFGRFDQDDAFQAAMEGLITEADKLEGKPRSWRVMTMKKWIHRASLAARFTMSISKNTWDLVKEDPPAKLRGAAGVLDWLVEFEDPVFNREDSGFEKATERVLVGHLLSVLNEADRKVIVSWMENGFTRKNTSHQYRRRDEIINRLRKEVNYG